MVLENIHEYMTMNEILFSKMYVQNVVQILSMDPCGQEAQTHFILYNWFYIIFWAYKTESLQKMQEMSGIHSTFGKLTHFESVYLECIFAYKELL